MGGQKYLPRETPPANLAASAKAENRGQSTRLWLLLLGIAIAVTIFRGAYEQIGNTIPLWTDIGVDRSFGGLVIPMTWFQSLNPLLVITLTPLLLFYWRRKAAAGRETSARRKMAIGALIVAGAFLLLATVSLLAGTSRANWFWLVLFFVLLTIGELYILPTGLGLFARLAPPRLGATTVASWFLTIFSGSLLAGVVGTLWSRTSYHGFFLVLAGLATTAAFLLWLLERPIRSF
jgi:POT family proton-dependent oligopeptide transporter